MSLATLPPELYSAILSHIPQLNLQVSTLNLSRAVPHAPVPLHSLFRHIVISRQQQVPQLYRRLHYPSRVINAPGDECSTKEPMLIETFTLETWQVDADVLVNLLALLPRLQCLSLKIGTVFAPEHLQDMFRKPSPSLSMLSLRFRPYVQRATYYQFLKGSYFDSTLELISDWPSTSALEHLSIIQDPIPPPPAESHIKPFAQPIVFFSLAPLTKFSLCQVMERVTHVRLRIPSRQLTRFIATSRPPGSASSFPNASLLDLSTCSVREPSDLEALLNQVGGGQLKHVILDQTGLSSGNDREWELLGRTCAVASMKRVREREKALKAWTEAESMVQNQDHMNAGDQAVAQERRPRRGRRGLATATVSLRDSSAQDARLLPVFTTTLTPQSGRPPRASKIRVLPPPPRLLSLSTGLSQPLGPRPAAEPTGAHEARARADFAKGWSDGLGQLRATWARLRQSQSNGIRVVRFGVEVYNEAGQGMLSGLVDVGTPDIDGYWEELQDIDPPVLCFAGSRGEKWSNLAQEEWPHHPNGCGHQIAWNTWLDNL